MVAFRVPALKGLCFNGFSMEADRVNAGSGNCEQARACFFSFFRDECILVMGFFNGYVGGYF